MVVVMYDSRRKESGTTKTFAKRLANALNSDLRCVQDVDKVEEDFILCTYTYGLGEVPKSTMEFLERNQNHMKMTSVVANGSSNFRSVGLFAVAGDKLEEKYGVPCLHKLDMGGNHEDALEVAQKVSRLLGIEAKKSISRDDMSVFVNGMFSFKSLGWD